jgi:hypothetical protein
MSRTHPRTARQAPFPPFPALLLGALLAAAGCNGSTSPQPSDIPDPVFTDPAAKLLETGDTDAYSQLLYSQFTAQDPGLVDASRHVYLTFYGGPGQRGLALSFLDTTNYLGRTSTPQARALWIQGNGEWQYAEYRKTNESEHWCERSAQEDPTRGREPLRDQVWIHGILHADPHPVTAAQCSRIWANYSAAYATLARQFRRDGVTVHARAFARGASASSGFWAECRTIRRLVESGDVASFKCATVDLPRHVDEAGWEDCPATCEPPP